MKTVRLCEPETREPAMFCRLLLISSLIAQLTFTFQCDSMSFLWPALTCPAPGKVCGKGTGAGNACESVASSCNAVTTCSTKRDTCTPEESPGPGNDDDSQFGNGRCDGCPPPLPLKMPGGKIIELILPLAVILVDRPLLPIRQPRFNVQTRIPIPWSSNRVRQAWLEIWRY